MVVWIIGLSGSGKSTLANEVVRLVRGRGETVALLDGDAVRRVFGDDLGHTLEDRHKNARRMNALCKLLDEQGVHVVCAILSLFEDTRRWNRENLSAYYEVFLDAPLETLAARDPKGLYREALSGRMRDLPGVDIPFPRPERPDLVLENTGTREELLAHAGDIARLFAGGRA
ncbi:MAG: adenylyl-sulfate kinase [Desulfovibrionaceae bacterium]|jgi:adenylylsulfate kinase|nr:adenylyl-sulfate kinase [Desulfovibrionaceae bacterium]